MLQQVRHAEMDAGRIGDIWVLPSRGFKSLCARMRMGMSVAGDGTTVVVGIPLDDTFATDAGSIQVLTISSTPKRELLSLLLDGVWSSQAWVYADDSTTSDKFGSAVAISGDTIVASAPF